MSEDALQYKLYRCRTASGSKDWGIATTPDDNLRTVHCATGHTVRRTDIPKSKFGDLWVEYHRREREKTAKGYEHVGTAVVEGTRLKELMPDPATARNTVHRWEIATRIERDELHRRLAWAVEQLGGHVAPDSVEYDAQAIILQCRESAPWVFGFCDDGGINASGRGGGTLSPRHGLVPRLILLYLLRCFPDALRITDGADGLETPRVARDSEFIGERLFDYQRVLELGSCLGLCLGPLSLLDWQDKGPKCAFWI